MRIVFATSEVAPFAKTGGLADVSMSLPKALAELGHDVVVIAPCHRSVLAAGITLEDLGHELRVSVGDKIVGGGLLRAMLPGSNVPVIFVRNDHYFDRDGLYASGGEDYGDNSERFIFFSLAVMEAITLLNLSVDILHTNDWQTGLIPAYLEVLYRHQPRYQHCYKHTATLHTIHNLAYQGVFWHWDMTLTGLGWEQFTYDKMEFYGRLSFLKTGLMYSHGLSTVSPRYAAEIQTSAFGCGLEGVLMYRAASLRGILNGVCTESWDPATDPYLAANYSVSDVTVGKAANKAALQETLGLPTNPNAPLAGVVGRLAWQKGHDLICESIPTWVERHDVQFAILGTGDPELEMRLADLARRYPQHVAVRLAFSDKLAHQIEAGADLFLMPSRYEPCGLNQMYSLIYGTVPIVHATGGLADTVVDRTDVTLAAGTANGFAFTRDSLDAFNAKMWDALQCYWTQREQWNQLIQQGMRQDWSWATSAKRYVDYYQELITEMSKRSES